MGCVAKGRLYKVNPGRAMAIWPKGWEMNFCHRTGVSVPTSGGELLDWEALEAEYPGLPTCLKVIGKGSQCGFEWMNVDTVLKGCVLSLHTVWSTDMYLSLVRNETETEQLCRRPGSPFRSTGFITSNGLVHVYETLCALTAWRGSTWFKVFQGSTVAPLLDVHVLSVDTHKGWIAF